MRNFITFNGKMLSDFGVYISGDSVFDAPTRDTEEIEVPGRNGKLTIDHGRYNNISIKYPAFIVREFKSRIEALRNFLLTQEGYVRLEDTYHPDQFRLAKISGDFTVKPIAELYAGDFDLTFDCYPQRFLKKGEQEIEITAATTIFNDEKTEALPLIRAYGTGSFAINGVAVQITAASGYTDIDCELQECFKDTLATNCNGNVVLTNGKFPSLVSGSNLITLSGLTKLEIKPRWWVL